MASKARAEVHDMIPLWI